MEIKQSIESTRDFALDLFHAGKLALIAAWDKLDSKACDAINTLEDEA